MSVPLSAADVLANHVVFELDCIDRMYCNAYVRKLTYPGGVASFFTHHRGSSAATGLLLAVVLRSWRAPARASVGWSVFARGGRPLAWMTAESGPDGDSR